MASTPGARAADELARVAMAGALMLMMAACSAQSGSASTTPEASGARADLPAKLGLCASCHNVDGLATLPGYPHLAGQRADYMRLSVAKYRSGERPHAAMRASVSALTEDDLNRIIDYYASLPRAPTSAAP